MKRFFYTIFPALIENRHWTEDPQADIIRRMIFSVYNKGSAVVRHSNGLTITMDCHNPVSEDQKKIAFEHLVSGVEKLNFFKRNINAWEFVKTPPVPSDSLPPAALAIKKMTRDFDRGNFNPEAEILKKRIADLEAEVEALKNEKTNPNP